MTLKDELPHDPEFVVPDYPAMFVCSINPWKERG